MSERPKFHPPAETSMYSRKKRQVLLGMVAIFAIDGLLIGLFPGDSSLRIINFAMAVAFAILVLSWCAHDRAERNIGPWRGFTFFVVVFPTALVMMPLYLCRTRGMKGLKSTALAAVFFFALCVVAAIVALLVGLLRA